MQALDLGLSALTLPQVVTICQSTVDPDPRLVARSGKRTSLPGVGPKGRLCALHAWPTGLAAGPFHACIHQHEALQRSCTLPCQAAVAAARAAAAACRPAPSIPPAAMPFLTRNGCNIAYMRKPAAWGMHADIVYLPGETGGRVEGPGRGAQRAELSWDGGDRAYPRRLARQASRWSGGGPSRG